MKITRQRLQELANIMSEAKDSPITEAGPSSANMDQKDDAHAFYSTVEALGELPGAQSDGLMQALEDGYYAVADNAPVVVDKLQAATKAILSASPQVLPNWKKANHLEILEKELKIYKDIQTLLDGSVLGTVL